ncbi:MAG: Na(+)-translocating NADH-quinone reductase subunit A, partial [Verrucomicrobia bacterium]|nr:Na(+)-translocating NADH-quinone reductase subunit A [Verrucomicrobiota bacterium]
PAPQVVDAPRCESASVFPAEFPAIKPRLVVQEGDSVKRGTVLFCDKRNEDFKFCSPAGGTVKAITLGPRRVLQRIEIEIAEEEAVEQFPRYQPEQILRLSRDDVLSRLLDTGYLALLRQRPFSRLPNPEAKPKSIFVNAMNSAPFQPDIAVVIQGEEAAFQAGLDAMTRLTDGKVHLCISRSSQQNTALAGAANVEVHTFDGPHPAGNSSIHIHNIDPISPGDTVWTVRAGDVIRIGKLLLEGSVPATRVVALGGPGVKETARKYYRIRNGAPLATILNGNLEEGEQRIINGDVLAGTQMAQDSGIHFFGSSITVIPEGRERLFLGWMAPGMDRYSDSPLFLSKWFMRRKLWNLHTNENGSRRAMVLTGLYDRYLPMRVMTDYLIRAILAHDTDEAIRLGILETDPEDFALCSFVCPSKMDLMGVVRKGLDEIEEEGI